MTTPLFLDDPYRKSASGQVTAVTDEGGLVLDTTIFYAQGGGQPGDSGVLDWIGGRVPIATTRRGQGADIVLLPAEPVALPPVGATVQQHINWTRRFGHMRVHTALHLLGALIPASVIDGAIGARDGRLDFDDVKISLDKMILTGQLNTMISRDLPVQAAQANTHNSIRAAENADPATYVRMVHINDGDTTIDLQPCEGTHVSRTSEIGKIFIKGLEPLDDWSLRVVLQLGT